MSVNNVATLRKFVELMSGGNADEAYRLLHPDVVAHEPLTLPYGGTYHGIAEFRGLMEQVFGIFELTVNEYEVHDAGDTVIARMELTLTARSSGRTLNMPMVELYSFTDGLISDMDFFYWDTQAVANILTSSPVAT